MKRKCFFSTLAMALTIIFSSLLLTACNDEKEPEVTSGRDELSNTSWKLVSISGWGASDSADWKGEILAFGPDGSVTEEYAGGGSEKGSYTLTDGKIRFDGINGWTNTWGSNFSYVISGNTMILTDNLGSMGSTFNFTKL